MMTIAATGDFYVNISIQRSRAYHCENYTRYRSRPDLWMVSFGTYALFAILVVGSFHFLGFEQW